jgi:c(7)-type cytochrome triheme protein
VKEEAPKAVEAPKVETPKVDAAVAPSGALVPPETILFPSEYGNVEFGHRKHFERVNNDCSTCHPKIFPQAREPLNYGKARHRSAEEYGTSCAACHGIKSTAFAAERNCQKCHDMGLPKH